MKKEFPLMRLMSLLFLLMAMSAACSRNPAVKPFSDSRGIEKDPVPAWFYYPPEEEGALFFSAKAVESSSASAQKQALSQIYAQMTYAAYASSAEEIPLSQFLSRFRETVRRQGFFLQQVSEVSFPLKEAVSESEREESDWSLDGEPRTTVLILAKISLSDLVKWQEQIRKDMSQPKNRALLAGVFALLPDKTIRPFPRLGDPLRKVYGEMGYEVQNPALDLKPGEVTSLDSLQGFLKKRMTGRVKKSVVALAFPGESAREVFGKTEITTLKASLVFQEVDPGSSKVLWSKTFSGQGVSLEKEPYGIHDAFEQFLIKTLARIFDDR